MFGLDIYDTIAILVFAISVTWSLSDISTELGKIREALEKRK